MEQWNDSAGAVEEEALDITKLGQLDTLLHIRKIIQYNYKYRKIIIPNHFLCLLVFFYLLPSGGQVFFLGGKSRVSRPEEA